MSYVEGYATILNWAPSICLPLPLQLFDHVSESLKDFLVEENIDQEDKLPLAFTFSFPCEHAALDKVLTLCILSSVITSLPIPVTALSPFPQAVLLDWSKKFRARGLLGKDVVQTLREAIERTGVHLDTTECWAFLSCFPHTFIVNCEVAEMQSLRRSQSLWNCRVWTWKWWLWSMTQLPPWWPVVLMTSDVKLDSSLVSPLQWRHCTDLYK